MIYETHARTLARAFVYRLSAFLLTVALTYWYTGDVGKSTVFSFFLHVLLSVDYYIIERLWLRVRWGLIEKAPEAPAASTAEGSR